jgi:hypothetical protein
MEFDAGSGDIAKSKEKNDVKRDPNESYLDVFNDTIYVSKKRAL